MAARKNRELPAPGLVPVTSSSFGAARPRAKPLLVNPVLQTDLLLALPLWAKLLFRYTNLGTTWRKSEFPKRRGPLEAFTFPLLAYRVWKPLVAPGVMLVCSLTITWLVGALLTATLKKIPGPADLATDYVKGQGSELTVEGKGLGR